MASQEHAPVQPTSFFETGIRQTTNYINTYAVGLAKTADRIPVHIGLIQGQSVTSQFYQAYQVTNEASSQGAVAVATQCVKSTAGLGVEVGCSMAGAALGTALIPIPVVGTMIGGALGAAFGSIANQVFQSMTHPESPKSFLEALKGTANVETLAAGLTGLVPGFGSALFKGIASKVLGKAVLGKMAGQYGVKTALKIASTNAVTQSITVASIHGLGYGATYGGVRTYMPEIVKELNGQEGNWDPNTLHNEFVRNVTAGAGYGLLAGLLPSAGGAVTRLAMSHKYITGAAVLGVLGGGYLYSQQQNKPPIEQNGPSAQTENAEQPAPVKVGAVQQPSPFGLDSSHSFAFSTNAYSTFGFNTNNYYGGSGLQFNGLYSQPAVSTGFASQHYSPFAYRGGFAQI